MKLKLFIWTGSLLGLIIICMPVIAVDIISHSQDFSFSTIQSKTKSQTVSKIKKKGVSFLNANELLPLPLLIGSIDTLSSFPVHGSSPDYIHKKNIIYLAQLDNRQKLIIEIKKTKQDCKIEGKLCLSTVGLEARLNNLERTSHIQAIRKEVEKIREENGLTQHSSKTNISKSELLVPDRTSLLEGLQDIDKQIGWQRSKIENLNQQLVQLKQACKTQYNACVSMNNLDATLKRNLSYMNKILTLRRTVTDKLSKVPLNN